MEKKIPLVKGPQSSHHPEKLDPIFKAVGSPNSSTTTSCGETQEAKCMAPLEFSLLCVVQNWSLRITKPQTSYSAGRTAEVTPDVWCYDAHVVVCFT